MRTSLVRMTVVPVLLCALVTGALAADWPMWRYDEQRRAVSPDALAGELHLQWVRELPEPMRAWPFQWDDAGKLDFDVSYEPVAAGTTLVVGSMVSDSVTAYDTRTGAELWRFYADGPVRFAPAVSDGRVYAGSDDGYLYCLDLGSGELLWSFRAAPRERYLLGNARMVNIWPVRGGAVVRDGTVYFAAGVFPFMGTFMYALDAETGAVEWENSGTGSTYNLHQHGGAFAFGGVSPQGYLVATEELLLIPGGRTPPAAHDRATGELVYLRQATDIVGKGAGGYGVWAQGGWFYNPNTAGRPMYALQDGAQLGDVPADVVSDDLIAGIAGNELVIHASEPNVLEVEVTDRLGRGAIKEQYELVELFRAELDVELTKVHIRAGDRLYASGADGLVAAIELPGDGGDANVSWQGQIDGTPWSMIAADDRLFVVSEEGAVFCFGADEAEVARHTLNGVIDRPQDAWPQQAAAMLASGATEGFALVLGAGSGRLVHELVGQSELHVIVVEPDAARAEQMRRLFDDAGYYGRRVAVLHADPTQVELAPYFADLVAAESLAALNIDPDGYAWERTARRIFEALRPYGGAAWLPLSAEEHQAVSEWAAAGTAGAQVTRAANYTTITREGPLPGAGQWTHQYADSGNSGVSWDSLARAPLGLLWYGGGYNNHNALPRHQNGPVPQVVGGRLVILGVDTISARDVYTGRKLWVTDLPGVGHAFTSLEHEEQLAAGGHPYFPNQPGANFVGSNYVSVEDGVYVGYEGRCLRLDAATGELVSEFRVPGRDGGDAEMSWGFVIHDDLIVTGADPQMFDDAPIGGEESWNATSSDRLVVMDRHSGQVLWQTDARIGFRHNAIIAAAGKVFVIDGLSEQQLELLERRGERPDEPARLMAFDARSGEALWTRDADTFGTWLSYSEEYDTLIQSGRYGARRPLPDEPRERMLAHRGETGEVLWERAARYSGPIALRGDQIITGRGEPAIDLRTGENLMRTHPLTGMEIPWSFTRTYGCGTQNVSENLITFRSGAAGYYDLARDGGTGNFGGTKAGCTNSMVVGDGVLNAPEYTRSCFCSYQLQTSYGLVHMPDAEMWTYTDVERGAGVVRRAGINLGAPGSRLDDAGTWWLEHPPAGGSALELPIEMSAAEEGREPRPFIHHSSWVERVGSGMDWVAASGIEGAATLRIGLAAEGDDAPTARYTVRLHFIEPGEAAAGQRQFGVRLQDREVITGLDVARQAAGAKRALVQEVTGVEVTDELVVALVPAGNAQYPPVLCGIELVLEDGQAAAAGQNRADASHQWAEATPPTWTERLVSALHLLPFVAWLR
jgi:outer membrane protein assembly factor BamB